MLFDRAEDALEEIIAEAVPTVFTDKEAMAQLVKENRTLVEQVRDFFIDFANKLKEILGVDKFSAVIVAYGQNFPDALTGSYLAAVKGAPILLTEPSADANLLNYLKTNLVSGGKVYILGGTAAVSQKFEDGAKDLGFDVKRLKGAGRYETNLEILKEAGVNATDEILIALSGAGTKKTDGKLKAGDVIDVECFLYWYNGANPHITKVTVK